MKKIISFILAVMLPVSLFCGCGDNAKTKSDKLSIVTTIFPEYDWVINILGDKAENAEVTMLLDSGVDLHSYQPTADDIIKISTCDLFIYVGGESDKWVEDALKNAPQTLKVINLLDVLGDSVKEEEVVEGMEVEDEEKSDEPELDEHVWLSLKYAEILVNAIKDELVKIDTDNTEAYIANASAYCDKLKNLDSQYKSAVEKAKTKTVLFADRFPFRYLTDNYGLSYYAAFVGCSAESEASFETIAFLANKTDELKLPAVIILEGTDRKIAETVISTSKNKTAQILTMDSMQSVTSDDVKNGADYLSIMEKNLETLKTAIA